MTLTNYKAMSIATDLIIALNHSSNSNVVIWQRDQEYRIVCVNSKMENVWWSEFIKLSEQELEELKTILRKVDLEFSEKKVDRTLPFHPFNRHMVKINSIWQLIEEIVTVSVVNLDSNVVIWQRSGKYDVTCEDSEGECIWHSDFIELSEQDLKELEGTLKMNDLKFSKKRFKSSCMLDYSHSSLYESYEIQDLIEDVEKTCKISPNSSVVVWQRDQEYDIACQNSEDECIWHSNFITLSEQELKKLEIALIRNGFEFNKKRFKAGPVLDHSHHSLYEAYDIWHLIKAVEKISKTVPEFNILIFKHGQEYDIVCEDSRKTCIWRSDFIELTEQEFETLKAEVKKYNVDLR